MGPHRQPAAPAETAPLHKQLDRVGKLLAIIVVAIAVVMIAPDCPR